MFQIFKLLNKKYLYAQEQETQRDHEECISIVNMSQTSIPNNSLTLCLASQIDLQNKGYRGSAQTSR